MRIITNNLVILVTIVCGGLSSCTTVDLTQVSVNQPQITYDKAEKNVVERASLSLTSMFHDKGWCDSDPAQKTKTATNVLLNGMDVNTKNSHVYMVTPVSMEQVISDIAEANYQVEQTTKAAEVYLDVADEMAELNKELSQLEAALLSSREAQASFVKVVNELPNESKVTLPQLEEISKSINDLKIVTDAYGDRIRSQIAIKVSATDS